MNIWKVKLQERWDYEKEYSDTGDYTVVASSYEKALVKADKVAKKKNFVDEKPEGDGKRHFVIATRLIAISQEDEIDA